MGSGTVRMGDDNTKQVHGIGSIQVKLHDGVIRILESMRYV